MRELCFTCAELGIGGRHSHVFYNYSTLSEAGISTIAEHFSTITQLRAPSNEDESDGQVTRAVSFLPEPPSFNATIFRKAYVN
jgi:hypothetical protein